MMQKQASEAQIHKIGQKSIPVPEKPSESTFLHP